MSDDYRDPFELPGADQEGRRDELAVWLAWLQQLAVLGTALSALVSAEVRLAASDLGRLAVVLVLLLPIALLTWISLSVFLSWLVYSQSGSPGFGFFSFFAIQAATVLYLRTLIKKYQRSLSLPLTRQHVADIMQDIKNGP